MKTNNDAQKKEGRKEERKKERGEEKKSKETMKEKKETGHPMIADGQWYPMPCLEWSNEA